MAICCGGKKQKVSHSVTSSVPHRRSIEKSNVSLNHLSKITCLTSSIRHRSHSHFNHQHSMPHDLSRSSSNSASSSALTYTYGTPKTTNSNHFSHQTTDSMDISDDDEEQTKKIPSKYSIVHADMIFYCFEILGNYLFNGKNHLGKSHSTAPALPSSLPNEHYPLFVTWLIGSEQKLRGCIGTFTPMNLGQGLREYALTSATNDSRFSPISRDEYPFLSCAVSILTKFEPCSSYTDWEIGRHGIRIEFLNERGAKRSATYLPEVAHEQGWNHIQTLDSLLRKGGYKATITMEIRRNVQVTRYQSEKLTLHYNDFIQSKNSNFNNHRHQF